MQKSKKIILMICAFLLINTTAGITVASNLEIKGNEQTNQENISSIFFYSGNYLTVDDDGSANYNKIQDAIDNSSDGDTVFVYNGTYIENININKSIILIGEEKNNTIIDGNYIGDVITISADWVTIREFTIKNCGEDSFSDAVIHINSKNNTIQDNAITWTNSNHISSLDNSIGIKLEMNSDNNNIINNEISLSRVSIILESSSNKICNNLIDVRGMDGIRLVTEEQYNPICSNNNISNNILYCSNDTFKDFGDGIWCLNVKDSIISDNTITDIAEAILLDGASNNNTIIRNNLSKNSYAGLSLYSNKNSILNNIISNNEFGIFLGAGADENYVQNNSASNNKYGIYLGYRASKNLIQYNNITNNRFGIFLTNNHKNKFYNNNFINNTRQVKFALRSILDQWKGNYWDNQRLHGLPKIIFGRFGRFIPFLNFDWHPAKEPYAI